MSQDEGLSLEQELAALEADHGTQSAAERAWLAIMAPCGTLFLIPANGRTRREEEEREA